MDSRKAPHVNGLSIVGGWGDASGQGGDVTKNSDFNKLFVGCPLNIATHVRDRAAQIQENEQKARNDQAPKAPGRFSLFHRFSLLASVSLFVWVAIFSGQPKKA